MILFISLHYSFTKSIHMAILDITKQSVAEARAKLAEQEAQAKAEPKQKGRPKKGEEQPEEEQPEEEQPEAKA